MKVMDVSVLVLLLVALSSHAVNAQKNLLQCELDFVAMLNPTNVVNLEMLDYTGKAVNDMGNYDGCIGIDTAIAQYCVLATEITVSMANEHLPVYIGICAPASCDSISLEVIIKSLLNNPSWNISSLYPITGLLKEFTAHCTPGHEESITAGAVATITLLVFLCLLVIAGTYLETVQKPPATSTLLRSTNIEHDEEAKALLHINDEGESPHNNGDAAIRAFSLPLSPPVSVKPSGYTKLFDVLKCFGLRANTKFLMADNRSSDPRLACLNGLRTVMMGWVVLGHTFTYMAAPVGYDNLNTIKDLVGRVTFQVIPAAELSVDIFFYLSGFLVVYMVLKEMKAKKGKMPWGLFYFHRYWRLTPVYAFVILLYTNITPYMTSGPFHFLYRSTKTDLCTSYWWTNMLYINNFYPNSSSQQCLGWSWYLANDMQFYIFTPIIILLYYKNRRAGWMLVSMLIALCMILDAALSYTYKLVPLDPNNNEFNSIIYNKPYTRMSPYLIGVAAAFLLQEDIDLSKNVWVRWIGYLIAATATTSATYLTVGFWRHSWELLQDVMYMTFARVGFTLGIAYVMYTFHKNHGGVLREVLSLYCWVPLARITYTVYLVHPIVIFVINFSTTTTFHYSAIYGAVRYSSHIIIAYLVGLLLHLVLEKPTANLERVFLPRGNARHK